MPALWLLWVMLVAWQPSVWLWALPAALPLANLSPWTGWLVFDEFDLMILGVLCALQGRSIFAGQSDRALPLAHYKSRHRALIMAQWCVAISGLVIGILTGGASSAPLFASYPDSVWSVRASKAWVWVLLLWPWIRAAVQESPAVSLSLVGRGMLIGLAVVTAACVYERLAYPGLLDFHSHYRTTALFWEMNVGGAAIDVYLAMVWPFAAWALWRAYVHQDFTRWLLASALSVLVVYACLTTFARGVYLAVCTSMLVLAWSWYQQHGTPERAWFWLNWTKRVRVWGSRQWPDQRRGWRLPATAVLLILLALEITAVLDGDSFMSSRMEDSSSDLTSRLDHWRDGISLLDRPAQWALGLGAGRFPAQYAASSTGRSFSGALDWLAPHQAPPQPQGEVASLNRPTKDGAALLSGPAHRQSLGGLYSMTQRVPLENGGHYSVQLLVRSQKASRLLIRVCERHLLYDGNCQTTVVQVRPSAGQWLNVGSRLRGPILESGSGWERKRAVFSIGVLTTQTQVEFEQVQLMDPRGRDVLHNGNFSKQLSNWFPAAQRYYLPWHTDNLLVELLVERGVFGALVFAVLVFTAVHSLSTRMASQKSLAPILLASTVGMLCVGLVSSVLDVPRVSFLVLFVLFLALALNDEPRSSL